MNGLGSAGVVKGLDFVATIIKEGKRLFANVYLALELVKFLLLGYLISTWKCVWAICLFLWTAMYAARILSINVKCPLPF